MITESNNNSTPAYKKLAAFNSIVLEKSNQTCLDYSYNNMIEELRNITWGSEGGMYVKSYDSIPLVICFHHFFVTTKLLCSF